MSFMDIALNRQSCRNFNQKRQVEDEKLQRILECARLAPSACNAQPYHITVCKGEDAHRIAKATVGMGINGFTKDVPVMLVISEDSYNKTAALGAKIKSIDYRSIDIGILCSHIVFQAHEEGLSTCILGWIEDKKIREICNCNKVHLIVALGYANDDDKLRPKKRKSIDELVSYKS
ncbi:MAG: nitroreductase family protein [Clostridia bacterium]|nr:nitroreductase family protein [Clostridia bacterium]